MKGLFRIVWNVSKKEVQKHIDNGDRPIMIIPGLIHWWDVKE